MIFPNLFENLRQRGNSDTLCLTLTLEFLSPEKCVSWGLVIEQFYYLKNGAFFSKIITERSQDVFNPHSNGNAL